MESIKKYGLNELLKKVMGKQVYFKADCQFFSKDGVKGKVTEVTFSNGIPLFTVNICRGNCNKIIHVDGGMKNLTFEVL